MKSRNSIKLLLKPYYVVNIFLSVAFIFTKTIPIICHQLYETCNVDLQEYEMLIMLGSFITIRSKRQSVFLDYIAHVCMFAKVCNIFMFYRQNVMYAILYGFLCLLQILFLKQPVYTGPDKVLYFRDNTFMEEVIHGDKKVLWLIAFYTAWSPACISLAPVFAELSQDYGLPNFKFAKLDVTRHPDLATKFSIDTSSWSNQLPTLILFKDGLELDRRPGITGKKKTIQKYTFSYENIVKSFDLNNKFLEQKQIKHYETKKTK